MARATQDPRKTQGVEVSVNPKRTPTATEAEAMATAMTRYKKMPIRPEMEISFTNEGTTAALAATHSDGNGHAAMLHEAVGSSSNGWLNGILIDLLKVAKERGAGEVTGEQASAALAFMAAIQPQNEVEGALGVQMYAAHRLAIEMASRCRHTTDRQATMEYGNLATKMMRTVTAQMDALGKMRRGGEQVVRHVHVYEGGQAIVADQFNHYGGENGNSAGQPYAPFAGHAPAGIPSLLGQDAAGNGVPITRDQGKEAVSDARRQKPRRSSRKQA